LFRLPRVASTGDCCDRLGECGTVQRAQLAEGLSGVFHQQLRQGAVGDFTLDQCSDRAFAGHVIQIVMTIEARTGQRNKQLAGLDRTAIDADAIKGRVTRDQTCIEHVGQFAELQGLKHAPPPTR
jgi:hypothetical protein